MGRYDMAIRYYSAALGMGPDDDGLVDIYRLRGHAYFEKGQRDKAIADWDHALRLPAKTGAQFWARAKIFENKGDYSAAARDYARAAELSPKDADAWNGVAWIKATAPINSLRNGQQALRAAMTACDLSNGRDPNCLDTLAAAYAETGNFDEAIKPQEKAIKMNQAGERSGLEQRLAAYRQHKPHREPVGLH